MFFILILIAALLLFVMFVFGAVYVDILTTEDISALTVVTLVVLSCIHFCVIKSFAVLWLDILKDYMCCRRHHKARADAQDDV